MKITQGSLKYKYKNYLLVNIPAHHQGSDKYEYPPDPDYFRAKHSVIKSNTYQLII